MSPALVAIGIAAALFLLVLFLIYLYVYISAPPDGAVHYQDWQKHHEKEARRDRIAFYRYGLIGYVLWAFKEARARKKRERQ